MELLAFFIWILLAFITPLVLIATCYFKYIEPVKMSKFIFRFFAAFVAYIPVTAFVLLYFGALLNAVIHKKVLSYGETFFCCAMVVAYGIVGYLLWSFVNGGFIKFWNFEKPQSIFNENS